MLEVQKYLLSGKTFAELTAELAIQCVFHERDPLCILNYDQIESPKGHPIVRECRGLVLHTGTFDVVARSFHRFFNWGEMQEEMKLFNFADFFALSKEDGSLCLLYHYDGHWRANTRGSFGMDNMHCQSFTWQEAFCRAMNIASLDELQGKLDPSLTYVCEFCAPFNKIVRRYAEPTMYLLAAYQGKHEVDRRELARTTHSFFKFPERYEFQSIEEVMAFLQRQAETDPTYEGVVICDNNGWRWKIKSATYLGLHRLRGEGDNLYNPKNLLPFILAGEADELLTYFPEVRETFIQYKAKVDVAYAQMTSVWESSRDIAVQKDFALAIAGKTPFTSILFEARKKKEEPKAIWRKSSDLILRQLF